MSPNVKNEIERLQKRLEELEQRCFKHQEEIHKLHHSHRQLKQRVVFFEQLVYHDYLWLLELYKERLSHEDKHKQYLI